MRLSGTYILLNMLLYKDYYVVFMGRLGMFLY